MMPMTNMTQLSVAGALAAAMTMGCSDQGKPTTAAGLWPAPAPLPAVSSSPFNPKPFNPQPFATQPFAPLPVVAAQPSSQPHWMDTTSHKGKTIRQWCDIARNKNAIKLDREAAIYELTNAGTAGAAALWTLLSAQDKDTAELHGNNKPWAANLVQPGFVRWHAVIATARMGQTANRSAPKLTEMMRQDDVVEVRRLAAAALGPLGSRDKAIIDALKGVLRSPDYTVWQAAIASLRQLGPMDNETRQLLQHISNINMDAPDGTRVDFNTSISVGNAKVEAKAALMAPQ
jgi:hypothetical protein